MGVDVSGSLDGGRMSNNSEFFGSVLALFWCFDYFIITSFKFMHEGMCREITMLGLIVETCILRRSFWL